MRLEQQQQQQKIDDDNKMIINKSIIFINIISNAKLDTFNKKKVYWKVFFTFFPDTHGMKNSTVKCN